jgi:hypothetical protein
VSLAVADFGGSGLFSSVTVVPGFNNNVTVTVTLFTVTSTGKGTGSSDFASSGIQKVYQEKGPKTSRSLVDHAYAIRLDWPRAPTGK